jgi:hypothetical protein
LDVAGKVAIRLIISLTKRVIVNNAIKVVLNAQKDQPDVQNARKAIFWIRNLTSVSNNKRNNVGMANSYLITNATHAHQAVKFAIHHTIAQNVSKGTIY